MSAEDAVGLHVSAALALTACAAMAVFYVAALYLPALVFRLPPPTSINTFMIRRFVSALFSSVVSVLFASVLLGMWNAGNASLFFHAFGIKGDHMLQAMGFPVILTCILYSGSLVPRLVAAACLANGAFSHDGESNTMKSSADLKERILSLARNVLTWRTLVVAPITEELVFRSCMIPLLLCGGFRKYTIIFFSPIFFSLAHLNHFVELYYQKGYSFWRASLVVGFQLGYTIIFGWYAAFLFIRTGNLICPTIAHILCNWMGLPTWSTSQSAVMVGSAYAAGIVGFFYLLFPMTDPKLYNNSNDDCRCWEGYCSWG